MRVVKLILCLIFCFLLLGCKSKQAIIDTSQKKYSDSAVVTTNSNVLYDSVSIKKETKKDEVVIEEIEEIVTQYDTLGGIYQEKKIKTKRYIATVEKDNIIQEEINTEQRDTSVIVRETAETQTSLKEETTKKKGISWFYWMLVGALLCSYFVLKKRQ